MHLGRPIPAAAQSLVYVEMPVDIVHLQVFTPCLQPAFSVYFGLWSEPYLCPAPPDPCHLVLL